MNANILDREATMAIKNIFLGINTADMKVNCKIFFGSGKPVEVTSMSSIDFY